MTNEELFEDLKQFIATTVSQQISGVEQQLEGVGHRLDGVEQRLGGVEHRMGKVEQMLDQIQHAVADAISDANEATDAMLKNHERRLRRLEHRAA